MQKKLPPDATLDDAIYELEFRQAASKDWTSWIAVKASPLSRSKPKLPNGLAGNHRPSAETDLADIVRYLAQHNSDAAARLGFELITRAESLAHFPEIGRVAPEFRQPNLREIICRSYRIIYRLQRENKRLEIVRFWHGARGFPRTPGTT